MSNAPVTKNDVAHNKHVQVSQALLAAQQDYITTVQEVIEAERTVADVLREIHEVMDAQIALADRRMVLLKQLLNGKKMTE